MGVFKDIMIGLGIGTVDLWNLINSADVVNVLKWVYG